MESANSKLEEKLKGFSEKERNRDVRNLANKMFVSAWSRVMEELGYVDHTWIDDIRFSDLEQHIGEAWFLDPKLEVVVGLKITKAIEAAFLKLRRGKE